MKKNGQMTKVINYIERFIKVFPNKKIFNSVVDHGEIKGRIGSHFFKKKSMVVKLNYKLFLILSAYFFLILLNE